MWLIVEIWSLNPTLQSGIHTPYRCNNSPVSIYDAPNMHQSYFIDKWMAAYANITIEVYILNKGICLGCSLALC